MARTGRPQINDEETLLAVAEIVRDNPTIAIAEAVRDAVKTFSHEQSEEATIRRIRDKFKCKRSMWLARVQEQAPHQKTYFMSRTSASFEPSSFLSLSKTFQNLPTIECFGEGIDRMNNLCVSPKLQQFASDLTQISGRMQETFNTPEMRSMFQKLETLKTAFNTPEMLQIAEQARRSTEIINRVIARPYI